MSDVNSNRSLRSLLDVLASFSMLAVSLGLAWVYLVKSTLSDRDKKTLEIPKELVSIAGIPASGASSSGLVVLEFSDFECPFCGKFAREVWPAINDQFVVPGRAQFAFRSMPLETIHKRAQAAARVAACAGQQQQFWQMHEALFKQPLALDDSSLMAKTEDLKLDEPALRGCLAVAAEGLVRMDVSAAKMLHVQYTPSFFFGVRVDQDRMRVLKTLSGFQSLPAFKKVLEETEAQINSANCGILTRIFGLCKAT